MRVKLINYIFAIVLFNSCQKIPSDNPFDPECSKATFTPSVFGAVQSSKGIELTWDKVEKNISGYKLLKSLDNGTPISLATLSKDSIHFIDNSISIGKTHFYTLVAYAGNNESDALKAQITPNILVITSTPTLITTNSAVMGGLITVAPGNTIIRRGVTWKVLNSNSNASTGEAGGAGAFSLPISNLAPSTNYIYQAYAIDNKNKWVKGNEISFTTNAISLPIINTSSSTFVSSSRATIGGDVIDDGGAPVIESGVVYSNSPNPTISNSKVVNGSGNSSFMLNLSGLTPNSKYYVKAYGKNSQGVGYGNEISFTTSILTVNTGSVSDLEGNVYKTVQIGTQVWMAENLKTTKYNNGTTITNVTDQVAWQNLTTGAYCWYNNSITNKPAYGALYNYYVIKNGNVCPTGWHVPSNEEWDILITFLGGGAVAGGKMKEAGTSHWVAPNTGATNSSTFTALPSGARRSYGFNWLTNSGAWWSSTIEPPSQSNPNYIPPNWYYLLATSTANVGKSYSIINDGNTIRCVGN